MNKLKKHKKALKIGCGLLILISIISVIAGLALLIQYLNDRDIMSQNVSIIISNCDISADQSFTLDTSKIIKLNDVQHLRDEINQMNTELNSCYELIQKVSEDEVTSKPMFKDVKNNIVYLRNSIDEVKITMKIVQASSEYFIEIYGRLDPITNYLETKPDMTNIDNLRKLKELIDTFNKDFDKVSHPTEINEYHTKLSDIYKKLGDYLNQEVDLLRRIQDVNANPYAYTYDQLNALQNEINNFKEKDLGSLDINQTDLIKVVRESMKLDELFAFDDKFIFYKEVLSKYLYLGTIDPNQTFKKEVIPDMNKIHQLIKEEKYQDLVTYINTNEKPGGKFYNLLEAFRCAAPIYTPGNRFPETSACFDTALESGDQYIIYAHALFNLANHRCSDVDEAINALKNNNYNDNYQYFLLNDTIIELINNIDGKCNTVPNNQI